MKLSCLGKLVPPVPQPLKCPALVPPLICHQHFPIHAQLCMATTSKQCPPVPTHTNMTHPWICAVQTKTEPSYTRRAPCSGQTQLVLSPSSSSGFNMDKVIRYILKIYLHSKNGR